MITMPRLLILILLCLVSHLSLTLATSPVSVISLPNKDRFFFPTKCVIKTRCNSVFRCDARNWESEDKKADALRDLGGDVHYPTALNPFDVEIIQQASGMDLRLPFCLLTMNLKGNKAYNDANPPGWDEIFPVKQRSRAHLWARLLGGSGRYFRNIVAFFYDANQAAGAMECAVRDAVTKLDLTDGDVVTYSIYVDYPLLRDDKAPYRLIFFANVKFSYNFLNRDTVVYRPWLAGSVDNEANAEFKPFYDHTDTIKSLKQRSSGTTPIKCVASTSNPLRSLDFYHGMNWDSRTWTRVQKRNATPVISLTKNGWIYMHNTGNTEGNKSAKLAAVQNLDVRNGASVMFRMRFISTTSREVKLRLGGGVVLQWTNSGKSSNWVIWNGSGFTKLATSNYGTEFGEILIVYRTNRITLYQRGALMFDVPASNGNAVQLTFNFQVLDANAEAGLLMTGVRVQENIYK